MNLKELRGKYPQYKDMSDQQFADAFHRKYYPDMDKSEFYSRVGYQHNVKHEAESSVADTAINYAKSSGNFLLDAIKPLDKPRNSLAVGFSDQDDPAKSYADKVSEGYHSGYGKYSAVYGLSGLFDSQGLKDGWDQTRYASTQDAIPENVREEYPGRSITAGLLGDMATDPLTWFPVTSTVSLGKNAFKAAGASKLFSHIADNDLFRAFNVYVGDAKKAKQSADKYRDYIDAIKYRGVEDSKKFDAEIRALSEETGVPVDTLKADITNRVETGNLSAGKQGNIEKRLVQRNREMLNLERELGIDIGDLGPTYMAHIVTPAGKGNLDARSIKDFLSNRPKMTHASAAQRELEGTVAEINAKRYYDTDKFFYDDPVIIQGTREIRHGQVVGTAKFMDDVKGLGLPPGSKDIDPSWRQLEIPGSNSLKMRIGENYYPPEVAKVIEYQFEVLSNPEKLNDFFKYYDSVQNWWKKWSLGARPAYHARNVVGNMWNSYLAGVKNPQRYQDAALLAHYGQKGKFRGPIIGRDSKELWNAAIDHGVVGKGQYFGDIPQSIENKLPGGGDRKSLLGKAWKWTASSENPILNKGFEAGQVLEENARLAVFIDRVKRGDSYEEAAIHVKKYLFDYQDLSPFEQNVMKRLIPFYTWSRKNIPIQLEALVTQPDDINKLNIIINNIQDGAFVPDPENAPDYIKESGPVYFGREIQSDVAEVATLMNYLPFVDPNRVIPFKVNDKGVEFDIAKPVDLVSQMASPLIKAPIEYFANYDSFRQKNIVPKEAEGVGQYSSDFMGIKMPAKQAHLAKNLVMLNEIDRLNPFNVFGESTYNRETGERKRSRSYFLNEEKPIKTPIGEYAIGTMRESRTDMPGDVRLIQYLLGVRPYSVDTGLQEDINSVNFKKDLMNLRKNIQKSYMQEKSRAAEELLSIVNTHLENL